MDERLLRARDVATKVSLSRQHIYKLVAQGKFPKPIKLSANAVRWLEKDIDKWIREKARQEGKK
jgi:prophage regulatory protein